MAKKPEANRAVLSTINVEILSLKNGLKKFDANFVRVKDKFHTALIMTNYNDTLGQIEGSVQVVTSDSEYSFDDIKGYYIFSKQTLTIMIEEKDYV